MPAISAVRMSLSRSTGTRDTIRPRLGLSNRVESLHLLSSVLHVHILPPLSTAKRSLILSKDIDRPRSSSNVHTRSDLLPLKLSNTRLPLDLLDEALNDLSICCLCFLSHLSDLPYYTHYITDRSRSKELFYTGDSNVLTKPSPILAPARANPQYWIVRLFRSV